MVDREQMRRWLAQRDRDGLTYRELSVCVGVQANTLCQWAWRLRHETSPTAPTQPAFVQLTTPGLPDTAACQRVEIVLRSRRRVIVDAAIDGQVLTRLLAVIERC